MTGKGKIGLGVGGFLLVVGTWVGFTAASVASEANRADTMLKDALAQHLAQPDLDAKLRAMGFEVTDSPAESTGKGPDHSLLFYQTHLTISLRFNAEGKNTGYHLDRA